MRRAPQVTWKGRSISRRASCDTPFTLRDAFWACNWRTRRSPCPFCRAEHALTPDPCRSNVSATRGATFPQRLCDARRTSFAARRNEPGTPGWDTFCSARRGVRARRTAVDRIGARRLSMDIRSVVRGVARGRRPPRQPRGARCGPRRPGGLGASLLRRREPHTAAHPGVGSSRPRPHVAARDTRHESALRAAGFAGARSRTALHRPAAPGVPGVPGRPRHACAAAGSGSRRTGAQAGSTWSPRANVAAKFPAAKAI